MKNISLLIKPASSLCGLRCKYCFYEDVSSNRSVKSFGVMSDSTAENVVRKAFAAAERGSLISFMFQGGEPTVAGLEFFKRFIALEEKYAVKGVMVEHSIQTNGMAIDREWAKFLRENNFLVGISIDGTEYIHDSIRVDSEGRGTWQRAVNAFNLLKEFGVETDILCVVTKQTAKKPQAAYRALRELGCRSIQFIPCLDPLGEKRGAMPYSLSVENYGKFLCGVFDCWYADWKRGDYVTIRLFEDYLRHLLRMPAASCSAAGGCGNYLVIEGDGSLYPCDFYVLDEYCLGNINEVEIDSALRCDTAMRFLAEGAKRPTECGECGYFALCRGGCRRDFDEHGGNYYCRAFQRFFAYAGERLVEMARGYGRN